MTEINNPKKYCNDSQSGSQQLPQDPCNCVPNIIAGPNIALTPNEDGSVTISAVVTDTDTILNNPHFIPGAPAGFNRLSYDLFNKLTNTTITADYTYVDIPDQDIQTLSIAGNNLSISNGNTIPLPTDTVTNTIAGNTIATHTAVDGTVVNINESLITPVNTPTVNLTASGIGDHTIAADVKVSSTAGNSLIVGPDGLFVPPIPTCEDMQDCVAPMFSSVGFTYDDVNNQIDTTGTNGQILQANGTGGATWVTPAAGHVAATTVDSSTVDFTQSGTDNQTITATVKVSAAVGNDIVVNADGLFVDVPTCEDIQDCVAPMMLSNGFVYDDVNNQLDTTGTNGQVLTANGTGGATWTTPTTGTTYTFNDTNTVDLTLTGSTVTADVRIDPSSCGVTTGTAGLRVDAKTISNTTSAIADQSAGITQTVTGCDRLLKLSLSTDTGQILKFGTDNKPLVRIDPTTATLSATGGILIQNDADSDIEILKSPVCADAGTDVSTVVLGQKTSNGGNWGVTHAQDWLTVRTAAAAMTLVPATDSVISVDATAASRVVTLVAPVNCERRDFWIKRVDNVVTNTVTINAQAGSTIEGVASITLSTTGAFGGNFGECAHIVWDSVNTRWLVI